MFFTVVFLCLVICVTLIGQADTSSVAAGEKVCPADNCAHVAPGPLLHQLKARSPEVS